LSGSALPLLIAADPASLAGHGLARLQEHLRGEAVSCAELAASMAQASGVDQRAPLALALAAVAAAADRSGLDNAFHNPAHTREVAVNWWLLARLHGSAHRPLAREAILLGLTAAFGHDLHHDGRGNGADDCHVAFRLETVAAAAVDDLLRAAGVSGQCRAAVSAMILCTDVQAGYAQLADPDLADPRFAALADETTLLSARMLRDADLMPSAGTSITAYRARTAELEQEAGLPLGALGGDAARGFFDQVVERRFLSPAAQHFAGNLAAIAGEAAGD